MAKMVQIRNVPDEIHRLLKAKAALEGLSLSEFLLREARRLAECPTMAEIRQRLASRTPVVPRISPARAVRAAREGR